MSDAELDRLISRWAARHAPELIARAQAEALDMARARLQARLVDALLDAADTRLAASTPAAEPAAPDRSSAPSEAPAPSDPLLWVYGIVASGSDEPPAGTGVDAHPIQLHRHAGMTALVSEVPRERFTEAALSARLEDLDGLEALARAHEAVLQTAMGAGAVVPFRLCTIYSSRDRLNAMLDREGLTLTALLDRLDGMQEWGVKAFLRSRSGVTAAASTAAASGTEYLSRKRERRESADAEREASETVVTEIHARLTESAAAAALNRPHDRRLSGRDEEMVLNAAYLVSRERADAFRAAVEDLGRRHERDGVELELTGPWPPHHFVETPDP